jgi:hypothetical protein
MKKKILRRLFLHNRRVYSTLYVLYIKMQNLLNSKKVRNYKEEVKRRSKLDIFSFKEIAKDFKLYSSQAYPANDYYGNSEAIRKKFGITGEIKGVIEHGIYFGQNIFVEEVDYSPYSIIYTYGSYRKDLLERYLKKKNLKKKVIEVGPYILYAEDYYDDEKLNKLKEKQGKTLVVFPSHSIENRHSNYKIKDMINAIEEKKNNFDTVIVCMYWKDIVENKYLEYEKVGYKIVSAGHRSDPKFLSRLKTIIKLSDMTMSNQVGTHIGYCVALKKAHWLFTQNIHYTGKRAHSFNEEQDNKIKYMKEIADLSNAFGKYQETITKSQLDLVRYYWGEFT